MMLRRRLIALAYLMLLISFAAPPTAQAAKVAKYGYEANYGQLVAYTLDPTTGRPRVIQALTTANLTGGAITVNPTGKFLFLTTGYYGGTEIYGYAIASTGLLTPIAASPFSSGGGTLKFAPTGKFAFTNVPASNSVQVFSVDTSTGVLTSIASVAVGNNPEDLVLTPKGTFLYAPNSADSTISGFKVNPTTGALTSVAGSPFPVSGGVGSMAMHPSGKFLYTSDGTTVSEFDINATTGALTAAGQFGAPLLGYGYSTISADGKFFFVGSSGTGVLAYTINQASGALTAVAGSPFTTPSGAYGVAVDPSSKFLYVSSFGPGPPLYVFSIDPTTGAITEITSEGLNGVVGGLFAYTTSTAAVKYSPTFAYATNSGSNSITELSIANGGLSYITGSPLTDTNGPQASTATPDGKFFYIGNSNGSISEYKIGKTGALSKIKGSPITGLSNPVALAIRSVDTNSCGPYNWLYAADPAADDIDVYTRNPKTGVLSLQDVASSNGNGPSAIAVDPFGAFTLAANTASNDVYIGEPCVGFISSVATGTGPVAMTIDPSNQFVYVANSGDNTVSAYSLTLASPYLTPISGSPFAAGMTPSAVVAEPYGQYLYIANSGDNTISAYSIDPFSGALTPISGTFSTKSGPIALSVSNGGNYLYVTDKGSGLLEQFTINSGGTLTSAGSAGLGTAPTSVTSIGTYK
ncbi:MAG TPA: beta-propeller fold lactonase family protein [Terriglobales bacterium]